MYPTIKQLKYLDALATYRHFGKAATACSVSQSTLSAGMQELEKQLGVLLFERTSKQVLITEKGLSIVEKARLTLHELDGLIAEARSIDQPLTGKLTLGVIPTIGPFMLPVLLPHLRSRFPSLDLYLEERQSEALLGRLYAGEIDVLLLALPYPMADTMVRQLFLDAFKLACAPDHPLASLKSVSTHDLEGEDLLLLEEGHCIREHALSACNLTNAEYGRLYQSTSLHMLVQMVANGLGVTLLPQMAIDAGIMKGVRLIERSFQEKKVHRAIGLVWRKTHSQQDELNLFADAIQEIWQTPR
jgi:LysR family hydrogen peroxide-inducible transcriptional activator